MKRITYRVQCGRKQLHVLRCRARILGGNLKAHISKKWVGEEPEAVEISVSNVVEDEG